MKHSCYLGICTLYVFAILGSLVPSVSGAVFSSDYQVSVVGVVDPTIDTTFDGDVFSISSGDSSLGELEDRFVFAHVPVSGDFEAVARVLGLQSVPKEGRIGLMARGSLATDASNVSVHYTGGSRSRTRYRDIDGGSAVSSGIRYGSGPIYLKLERIGYAVRTYSSYDGLAWSQMSERFMADLPVDLLVGVHFATGSGLGSGQVEDVVVTDLPEVTNEPPVAFDANFSILEEASLNSILMASDPEGDAVSFLLVSGPSHGEVAVGNDGAFVYTPTLSFFGNDQFSFIASDGTKSSSSATVSISVRAVNSDPSAVQTINPASGPQLSSIPIGSNISFKDVYLNPSSGYVSLAWSGGSGGAAGDSLHFVSAPSPNPVQSTVRVDSLEVQSGATSAGLMIRSSEAVDATFVSIGLTSDDMLRVSSREEIGGVSDTLDYNWVPAPVFLRLYRNSNTVRLYVSEDGLRWRFLEEMEIAFPSEVELGIYQDSSDPASIVYAELSGLVREQPLVDEFRDRYQVGDFGGLVTYSDFLEFADGMDHHYSLATMGGSTQWPIEDGTLAYVSLNDPWELSARLDALIDGSPSAAAGLMLREGLSEDARFVSIFLDGLGQVRISRREQSGGGVVDSDVSVSEPSLFLRMSEVEGFLTVSYSFDSSDWIDAFTTDLSAYPFASRFVGLFAAGVDSLEAFEARFALVSIGIPDPTDSSDSDGDGLPDSYESANGLDPENPDDAATDLDEDGLSNLEEFQLGTDPQLADSDGDGMPDGWEVDFGLDPSLDDSTGDLDGDSRSNMSEYAAGSSPIDYYNGVAASIVSLSDPMGDLGPLRELVVRVVDPGGTPLANAPVEFFPVLGSHGVAAAPTGEGSESVVVRTDSEGLARAYLRPLSE